MAAIAADRDLLFGLLALQNGLIDQVQLVAAFQAWTRDKERPLAEHLVVRGDLDADQRAGIEAMVTLHLKKHGGDAAKSLGAIPTGRSTRENLARVGDADVEASLALVTPASTQAGEDADRTTTYTVGSATSDGQRFRILRPYARGGLGAVFVALDTELHREVALKQILDSHADDPSSRQRFLLEAEVTGGLEHPGIVPVYGLGAYGDGRPYYAMRFIRGDSLKEVIADFHAGPASQGDAGARSLALMRLLRRFIDICDAIGYAHGRGVLHRDIKPGNVIVGKHGETLVVDWGLAKAVGKTETGASSEERPLVPSSASGSAETQPGSALGTPAYMSPEQAGGDTDRLGPQSDVYSLGATLYCLLTGKAPFEGDDLGEILRRAQKGNFLPPRDLDPSISRSLEAVCLKAMAPRPEGRYVSPRALAEDIERWMADEPVEARREPLSAHAARWARRHRTAVAGLTALTLTAVVALSVSNVLIAQERSRTALAQARAETNFRRAQEAVDHSFTEVSETVLLRGPGLQPLRRRLLESARGYYEQFVSEQEGQAGLEAELGRVFRRLAQITAEIESPARAIDFYRRALSVQDKLVGDNPGVEVHRPDRATSRYGLAVACRLTGQMEAAREAFGQAISEFRELSRAAPGQVRYRIALAKCLHDLAGLYRVTGRIQEAGPINVEARDLRLRLAEADPADHNRQDDLASTFDSIGDTALKLRQNDSAEDAYGQAIAIRGPIVKEHPEIAEYRRNLAAAYLNLGTIYHGTRRIDRAEGAYREALSHFDRLAKLNPDVIDYRFSLSVVWKNLGVLHLDRGQQAKAAEAYRESVSLNERLARDNPEFLANAVELGGGYGNLGLLSQQLGHLEESLQWYDRSIQALLAALHRERDHVTARSCIQNAYIGKALTLTKLRRHDAAVLEGARALAWDEATAVGRTHYNLAWIYSLCSAVARDDDRLSIAERNAQCERDAARAIELLGEARSVGYFHTPGALEAMNQDHNLDPLRLRPDFQLLSLDLAFPDDPFARSP
jgi:eukaryotic-like serine/threonine-protein kinase